MSNVQSVINELERTITRLKKLDPTTEVAMDTMCNGEGDSGYGLNASVDIGIEICSAEEYDTENDFIGIMIDVNSSL